MKDRILRTHEVIEMTGMSRPTIWRKEKAGAFPARRQLGANSVGWLESEVIAWMDNLPCSSISGEAHHEA